MSGAEGLGDDMGDDEPETSGVRITFNPFNFTIEQNNEFIAMGYEPLIVTGVLP